MRARRLLFALAALALVCAACTTTGPTTTNNGPTSTPNGTFHKTAADNCPESLGLPATCLTPHAMRVAYGVQPLTDQGYTGKGETIVDIVSYGSPTLQQDMDTFDQQFGLPNTTIQVIAPLGTVPFDPNNGEMSGWQGETTLDVEIMHALAPDAHLVVLTSPVDETEGTQGLPQFLQLEQYAVQHQLGPIFSQSWTASEATLTDSAGQQVVQQFTSFYQQITTQNGYTIFTASGDTGATDCATVTCQGAQTPDQLEKTPTIGFPADNPWITSVGGSSLAWNGSGITETVWNSNGGAGGGGLSKFFPEPSYQQGLLSSVQSALGGHRAIPDVAADADPDTGMAFYCNGQWQPAGGTSAAAPVWAGIMAVADQMAGHPLGFINPGLYKVGESASASQDYRDITSGDNSFTLQDGTTIQGVQAGPGWDNVTGWGAPLADKLIPALIQALK